MQVYPIYNWTVRFIPWERQCQGVEGSLTRSARLGPRVNDKFGERIAAGEKIKSLLAQVSRTSEVPFGRQVPFSLAGFIVLAAYKVPARGTILNGSEAKALRGCVFGEAEVCICTRGHPERRHIGLSTYIYIPSLNFKKNKGISSRRDFRRMVAEATTFFNRASSWKARVWDLPGPESNLYKA